MRVEMGFVKGGRKYSRPLTTKSMKRDSTVLLNYRKATIKLLQ